jgi:hypothetical protein
MHENCLTLEKGPTNFQDSVYKSQNNSVKVEKQGDKFILLRNGQPYYIKGIGGNKRPDLASQYGANSLRIWEPENVGDVLDTASRYDMTAMLGIEMATDNDSYLNDIYRSQKRSEIQGLLEKYKNHPALLIWAIGNEINLGTNSAEAWKFVNELAQEVKRQDPNHLTCTVIAYAYVDVMNNIARYAPAIDIIGINAYAGGLPKIGDNCRSCEFKGPYIITEWGSYGHWEIDKTSWDVPIEETSSEKVNGYRKSYQCIYENRDLFLGSYVFWWGQKEELTPTWFSMFVEDMPDLGLSGESCPMVDLMKYLWSGSLPEKQAPDLTALKINGLEAIQSIILDADQNCTATVEVTDPDGDDITIVWEFLEEATQLSKEGSYEPRPERVGDVIKGASKEITFTAPGSGRYRLYAYALDGKGHVGTANFPFMVR